MADAPMVALLKAFQIAIGLALLGRGLTAPNASSVRAGLVAAGIAMIFLRIDLLAG